uniref:Putative lipocalin-3 1 n=1 Tax=Amblyomma cajennense TaxID=34607 RepID=A0A023FQZ9_AMBCJ
MFRSNRKMYATFLLAMLLTTEASAFSWRELRDGFNTSIEQFYNTNEPIWTIFTKADASFNLSCIVDVTLNTTLSNLYFERSYYRNQTRVKSPLRRVLNKRGTDRSRSTLVYDATRSIYEQGNPLFNEELLYQSDDGTCGVFKFFKHPNVTRYDIRVRNCSLAIEPPKNCWTFFKETSQLRVSRHEKLQERKVYDAQCQAILWKTDGCQ